MAVITVTGDIGAGKSTVSKILAEILHCKRIDADIIAKNLWFKDYVKAQAVSRWGKKILDASGKISIPEISRIIFNDKNEHKFCNDMIHPLVMSELKAYSLENEKENENIVLEIPLLFEAGRPEWINFVVYVAAGFDVRAERCRVSRGWSTEELKQREKFLLPRDEKIAMSDYILHNDGDIKELKAHIENIKNLNTQKKYCEK